MKRSDEMRELINIHSRRLHQLEMQKATSGMNVDPRILIEIDNVKEDIAELENKLKREIVYDWVRLSSKERLTIRDLSNIDLRAINLESADLRGVSLIGADLRHSNLKEANLSGADLRQAKLSGADLRYAKLHQANLGEADLDEAILVATNLRGANLQGANLGIVPQLP